MFNMLIINILIKFKGGNPLFNFNKIFIWKREVKMKTKQSAAVIKFLDSISKSVLLNVSVESYFTFSKEKKMTTQFLILKMIIKSMGVKLNTNDAILPNLLKSLKNRNEDLENYEFAEVLKNIESNLETLLDMAKTNIRPKRNIKTNNPNDV